MSITDKLDLDSILFTCNICNAKYMHKRSLNTHIRMKHTLPAHDDISSSSREMNKEDNKIQQQISKNKPDNDEKANNLDLEDDEIEGKPFWSGLIDFWKNEWSFLDKYKNYILLCRLSSNDETVNFINTSINQLWKMNTFNIAYKITMIQVTPLLNDIGDRVMNIKAVSDEDDDEEDEDDEDDEDISFWKLLLSEVSNDIDIETQLTYFFILQGRSKGIVFHDKIMKEVDEAVKHFNINKGNVIDAIELILNKYEKTIDDLEQKINDIDTNSSQGMHDEEIDVDDEEIDVDDEEIDVNDKEIYKDDDYDNEKNTKKIIF